jgi:2-polyprenyl-6-hydroxyphenyl methylase / 3-demethylubiquinone-9 3-methyltransferase
MERVGTDRLAALLLAIELVRRGGTIRLSGVYGGMTDPIPMMTLFDKLEPRTFGHSLVMFGRVLPMRSRQTLACIRRPRNDLRQYDDLIDEWWSPGGAFAALHWLAASRRSLIPSPLTATELLVDVGCGAGLMADAAYGYLHVGVDLVKAGLEQATLHGVHAVRADAARLPISSSAASVVLAGEILEHVHDLEETVAEICRVLRPGGTVVIDTINDTRLAKFLMVTIAERLPGGPPRGIHDPHLFVDPIRLQQLFAAGDVHLAVWGLRPSVVDYLRFLLNRDRLVRMLPTKSTALVYQGVGKKRSAR